MSCPVMHAEPVESILLNGSPANRIDIVIMGDGFTEDDMPVFEATVESLVEDFFTEEPFREYAAYFNVIRVDVTSIDSGVDHPERGEFRNTALGGRYNCGGVQRAVCVSNSAVNLVLDRSVELDQRDIVIVVVNDTEWGGTGGAIGVISRHPRADDIMLHEVGHVFGLLADEYDYGPPDCDTSFEPPEPNLTRVTDRSAIKWNQGGGPPIGWIEAGTAVPTLTTGAARPGLYEGGGYCTEGLYRPTYDSMMRDSDNPFEQVNEEQLVKRIYNLVSPIDAVSPASAEVQILAGKSLMFSVSTTEKATESLSIAWYLDDEHLSEAGQVAVHAAGLDLGSHRLRVEVTDETHRVRHDPANVLWDVFEWDVVVGSATNPVAQASNPGSNQVQQGFVRIVNAEAASGPVSVRAIDDSGADAPGGELSLEFSPQEAMHFTLQDLESGDPARGLVGALGSGTGKWRLAFESPLALRVMSLIRTPDGFLTNMSELAPHAADHVPLYFVNPASNQIQQSFIRLINRSPQSGLVTITAIDDAGNAAPGGQIALSMRANESRHFTNADLEAGNLGKGLIGSFGDGDGKWRLQVHTSLDIEAMSLIRTPDGFLTNLSRVVARSPSGSHEVYFANPVGLYQETFLRVINLSSAGGTVTIDAIDDAGAAAPGGQLSFDLGPRQARHFNSSDLEQGNAAKGLSGSLGDGSGRWRLSVESALSLVVMSLVRTPDDFVTNLSDVVTDVDADGVHYVYFFNPANNLNQRSFLRIINEADSPGAVSISGIDDAGVPAPLGTAAIVLNAREAVELSAVDLEQGNSAKGLAGRFGDGEGKWVLLVESELPLQVMSIMDTPNGFITNMSQQVP